MYKSKLNSEEKQVLKQIMQDLKRGYVFGNDRTWDHYSNRPLPYPYFDVALRIGSGRSGLLLRWHHFGSSANACTMRDLEWVITEIFQLTPSQFLDSYIRSDASSINVGVTA